MAETLEARNTPDVSTDAICSDDDGDDYLKDEIELLKAQIKESPYTYDHHVKLIRLCRKAGELLSLRDAHETMSKYYPLSPELWLAWIQDEIKLVSCSSDREYVIKLFKRAVDDYEAADVWLEYCQFAIGGIGDGSPQEVASAVDVFESALSHQGLNVARGAVLWEVYREFLLVILARLEHDPQAQSNAIIDHLKKMDRLFRRQLSIPLLNMESTFAEYEAFLSGAGLLLNPNSNSETVSVPAECKKDYEKALSLLSMLLPFEERIEEVQQRPEETMLAWCTYLDWAVNTSRHRAKPMETGKRAQSGSKSASHSNENSTVAALGPNNLICLFERAVTANCLETSVWIRFLDYLETDLASDIPRILRVCVRSVRNCPWSAELWLRHGKASEANAISSDVVSEVNGDDATPSDDRTTPCISPALQEVAAIYEAAVSAGFQHPTDLLQVWIGYCDFWVRRLQETMKDSTRWRKVLDEVRSTFQRALHHLDDCLGPKADPSAALLQYFALFEAKYANDLGRARTLWSGVMQGAGHGSQLAFWTAYIQFEHNYGDHKHLLRVANMAINSVPLEQYEELCVVVRRATAECGVPISRIRELELRLRSRRAHLKDLQEVKSTVAVASDNSVKEAERKPKERKRPHSSDTPEKNDQKRSKADAGTTSASTSTSVKKQQNTSKVKADGNMALRQTFSHDRSKNKQTVFISNLDYGVTAKEVEERFKPFGELASVRLVGDYAGRSKGFAYVQFVDVESAVKALALDRQPVCPTPPDAPTSNLSDALHVRPMYVSECDPEHRHHAFQYAAGKPEPEKLFIRNLDKRVTKDALQNIFNQHGTVVSVRLATYRNGAPKGHAYVEFTNADDASRALVATDGLLVGDTNISVAISNPPVRQQFQAKPQDRTERMKPPPASMSSTTVRTHARTQLEFLPRAVHRPATSAGVSSAASVAIDLSAAKSNADFRKMFLQQ